MTFMGNLEYAEIDKICWITHIKKSPSTADF